MNVKNISPEEGRAVVPMCGNCCYFSPPVKDDLGHCRRLPPSWRHEGVTVGAVSEYKAESAFPRTILVNWCGEFRPTEPGS